ncbi:MAG: polysaccharide deacetylase family protein [Gaiellaceae bacterium]
MSVLEHRYGIRDDVVALTFDDGPSPWTGPILDLLAAHESHATFFALGCLADVDGAEQTLRRILETGSEIGNHTFSHPSLPELDDDSIRDELERAGATIEEASGTTLRYWRPPFFHVDERVREVVSPLGLQEVGCAMMPWDWEWDAARSATFVIEGGCNEGRSCACTTAGLRTSLRNSALRHGRPASQRSGSSSTQ